MGLETVTEEELELERIEGLDKSRTHCQYREQCEEEVRESGNFIRCYLDTCALCPHYLNFHRRYKNANL